MKVIMKKNILYKIKLDPQHAGTESFRFKIVADAPAPCISLSHKVNNMAADDLATQVASSSAAMILT